MNRSVVIACVLLGLIAVLHTVRIVFGISLMIAGEEVSLLLSVLAIVVFGAASLFLWREMSSGRD